MMIMMMILVGLNPLTAVVVAAAVVVRAVGAARVVWATYLASQSLYSK